jgi:hypothetical protein
VVGQVPLRFLRAYIYEDGRFIRVDAPGVSNTTLNDINDRGQSIGQAFDSADPKNSDYTFLRERDGTFTRLPDVPGAVQTIHIGLNNRGQTAATAAFLSADGTFVTLRAFRYDDGEPTRIAVPGAVSTFATAINDRGHIVGYYTDPAADGAAGRSMGPTSWASTWMPTRSATASGTSTVPIRRSITRSPPPTARPTTSTTEASSSACTSAPPASVSSRWQWRRRA